MCLRVFANSILLFILLEASMCGIVAIFGKNHSIEACNKMLDNIQHRGPDGRDVYKMGNVVLGHVRLSIVDDQGGSQPMSNSFGETIVFNGEIYNHEALRKELGSQYTFKTRSDTEVILALYHLYGIEKALSKMKGMFAFVIHDTRNNKVVIATDRFKIKPLYSYYTDDTLWIFSEPRAMEGLMEFQVEYKGFYSWLVYDGSIDSTTNFFKDIKGVPAASYCELNLPCDPSYKQYYKIQNNGDTTLQKDEIIDKLKFLLEQSVVEHTSSDHPLSVMLSGGIDSNIVDYFLHKNNIDFQNFTGRYDKFTSFEGDETFIGSEVSKLYKVGFNEVNISNQDFLSHIYNFVKCMNYPKQGSAVFSRYMVLKGIKGKHKVAFSGNGADEVFCGYPWLLHEAYTRKNIGIPSSINFTQMSTSIFDSKSHNQHMFNKNQTVTKQQYYQQWHLYKQRYRQHDGFDYTIFTEDIPYCNLQFVEEFGDIRDVTAHEVRTWNRSILSAEDNVAMTHGIENRVPFLDHELVDFVFTIPERELLPNGLMKGLLLKSMMRDLPESVVKQYFNKYTNEGKNVFIAPLTNWFVKDSKIKQFAYDILNSQKAKNRDYRIKQDITPKTAPPAIWRLLVLELWHQHFIDRV